MHASRFFATCLMIMGLGLASHADSASSGRTPLLMQGKKTLYQRVLTKPRANIYATKDEKGPVAREAVPAFQPFFVYGLTPDLDPVKGQGWYEVGADDHGKVLGFLNASDAIPWKHTICMMFQHPGNREPVLFFEKKDLLKQLENLPLQERTKKVASLYSAINSRNIPPDFPIISMEPRRFVAAKDSSAFYLMPVLDFEPFTLDKRSGHLLQVVSVAAQNPGPREASDIRKNKAYLEQANTGSTEIPAEKLAKLKADMVWVIDTTLSMQPYIDKTLEMVNNISTSIQSVSGVGRDIHFGVWGYRDSPAHHPGIEYNTFNYTPQLLPIDTFKQALSKVRATRVDAGEWDEDVFSGLDDAIRKTAWTPNALRFLILVGDAPGHALKHPKNLSGQSAEGIHYSTAKANIFVFSVAIKDQRATRYFEDLEAQFSLLSYNEGHASGFESVASTDQAGFYVASERISQGIVDLVRNAKQGKVPTVAPGDNSPKARVARVVRAALIEWIGTQEKVKPPREITAWTVDRDLIDSPIVSMDAHILLTKRQLDDLAKVVQSIIQAGNEARTNSKGILEQLKATAATLARDPDRLSRAQTLAQSSLLPEFIDGLPYDSHALRLKDDIWAAWSDDDRTQFLREIESKRNWYRNAHDSNEWIALNPGDDPDDHVYPLSLEMLP